MACDTSSFVYYLHKYMWNVEKFCFHHYINVLFILSMPDQRQCLKCHDTCMRCLRYADRCTACRERYRYVKQLNCHLHLNFDLKLNVVIQLGDLIIVWRGWLVFLNAPMEPFSIWKRWHAAHAIPLVGLVQVSLFVRYVQCLQSFHRRNKKKLMIWKPGINKTFKDIQV